MFQKKSMKINTEKPAIRIMRNTSIILFKEYCNEGNGEKVLRGSKDISICKRLRQSTNVTLVRELLAGSGVKTCCTIGFRWEPQQPL